MPRRTIARLLAACQLAFALATAATAHAQCPPPFPLQATISGINEVCFGGSAGSASVVASGGLAPYTYSWAPHGGSAASASNLDAGTFTVTITDACSTELQKSVTITQPAQVVVSIGAITGATTRGGCDGTATASVTGGVGGRSYTWSNSAHGNPATGLCAGTYSVTVQDANTCPAGGATLGGFVVTQPPTAPTIGTATAGFQQISVTFTQSGDDGGSAITGYLAQCGSGSGSGSVSPIVVTGVAKNVATTCKVAAINANGQSPWSADSNSVTPNWPPQVTAVSASPGAYGLNQVINFAVDFDEPVVPISPYFAALDFYVGSDLRHASLHCCGPYGLASEFSFDYTVQNGDYDNDGILIASLTTFYFQGGTSGMLLDANPALNGIYLPTPTVNALYPVMSVSPPNLDFGSVAQGFDGAAHSFVINNTGYAPLTVSGITGFIGTDYSTANTACFSPNTIAAGGSCQVDVVFHPTALGTRTAHITFDGNGLNTASAPFDLTGMGEAVDTTPGPFSFVDVTGVTRNFAQTSNAVTIMGINAPALVSVTGGSYSIGCTGTFTTLDGSIANGQTVCVQHTSASGFGANTDTALTVGGISDTFTSTTLLGYTLTVQRAGVAAPYGLVSSFPPISCPGACSGTYDPGAVVTLPATSTFGFVSFQSWSGCDSVVGNQCMVTMNTNRTVTASFTADVTPDPFTFTAQTDVPRNAVRSVSALVTGLAIPADVSVVNGAYSVDCTGTYVTTPGTAVIGNGHYICVQNTASSAFATAATTTLTVGTYSTGFTTTTVPSHNVTVSLAGSGGGTVAATGIACPGDCTEPVGKLESITLTATPNGTSTFTSWSAGCSGVVGNQCVVIVGNADVNVTATFTAFPSFNLVLEGWQVAPTWVVTPAAGTGTAIYNPTTRELTLNLAYADLTGTETAAHLHGPTSRDFSAAVVRDLPAGTPKSATFTLTTNEETDLLSGALYVDIHTSTHPDGEIRAQIDALGAAVTHDLTVTHAVGGRISASAVPGIVIDCGSDCSETIPHGKIVSLSVLADPGYTFAGWTGDCSGTSTSCFFQMNAAKSVGASFTDERADLSVSQVASPNPASIGEDVTFTVTVTNHGPTDAGLLNMLKSVPAGWSLVSASPECTQSVSITCALDALAVNASKQFTIVMHPSAAGTSNHNAAVNVTNFDPNYGDNLSTISVTVDPAATPGSADVAIAQSPSPGVAASERDVVLTLTATNNGPATATSVSITNTVPFGATYVWASPGCVLATGVVSCSAASLAMGANASFKLVLRPAAGGSITNIAHVTATESDPASANNTSSLTIPVNASPAGIPIQRYRLYSDVTKEHHFTTDLNEYNVLGTYVGTWVQEGGVGKILNNPGSFGGVEAVPYYRLYDNSTRWHHWTTDPNEYYTLGYVYSGWNLEGVDGWILPSQAAGTTELYRLNYPALGSLHHWTIDANEFNTLISTYGWIGEPGAGFVVQ